MARNWRELEAFIIRDTKGKATPGSGNKRIKGDVRATDREGLLWCIEAKFSEQSVFTLKREWLDTLYRTCGTQGELALVCGWNYDTVVYTHSHWNAHGISETWRTLSVSEVGDFPSFIYTDYGVWALQNADDFYTLFG